MKNYNLPLWLVCPAILFLFLICQITPAGAANEKAAGEPELLYTIKNGKGVEQMNWFTDKGKIEAGHLRGPGAILALNDELRLFADTLNQRLILRKADSGRVVKIFNLPSSREVELKYNPLIIDLADAGNGLIYAADEANMLIWKIDLGKNWRGPEMKVERMFSLKDPVEKTGAGGEKPEKTAKNDTHQFGRIFADHGGVLYAADMPQQNTVSFSPDGLKKFAYEGLTNGVPDKSGLLYHPVYYGDAAVRDIEVFDSKGRMAGHHGQLKFGRPIVYIAPLGFDAEDTMYVFADSEKGPLMVRIYRKDQKQVFTELDAADNSGFGSAPYWIGPAGSVEWAEYNAESVKIYRRKL